MAIHTNNTVRNSQTQPNQAADQDLATNASTQSQAASPVAQEPLVADAIVADGHSAHIGNAGQAEGTEEVVVNTAALEMLVVDGALQAKDIASRGDVHFQMEVTSDFLPTFEVEGDQDILDGEGGDLFMVALDGALQATKSVHDNDDFPLREEVGRLKLLPPEFDPHNQAMPQHAQQRLGTFFQAHSDVDISALVQYVIRGTYLDGLLDLEFHALKVRYFNDLKKALREEATEMRNIRAEYPNAEPEELLQILIRKKQFGNAYRGPGSPIVFGDEPVGGNQQSFGSNNHMSLRAPPQGESGTGAPWSYRGGIDTSDEGLDASIDAQLQQFLAQVAAMTPAEREALWDKIKTEGFPMGYRPHFATQDNDLEGFPFIYLLTPTDEQASGTLEDFIAACFSKVRDDIYYAGPGSMTSATIELNLTASMAEVEAEKDWIVDSVNAEQANAELDANAEPVEAGGGVEKTDEITMDAESKEAAGAAVDEEITKFIEDLLKDMSTEEAEAFWAAICEDGIGFGVEGGQAAPLTMGQWSHAKYKVPNNLKSPYDPKGPGGNQKYENEKGTNVEGVDPKQQIAEFLTTHFTDLADELIKRIKPSDGEGSNPLMKMEHIQLKLDVPKYEYDEPIEYQDPGQRQMFNSLNAPGVGGGGGAGGVGGSQQEGFGPNGEIETIAALDAYIGELEERLATAGDDAQLGNMDLQNVLQKNQQALQLMSNMSKMLHDTSMAIIRKIAS